MKAIYIILAILPAVAGSSCKKYLDVKSNESLAIPNSLTDLQSIFDHPGNTFLGVGISDESCDDYYIITSTYNSLYSDYQRRRYIWSNSNIFPLATPVNNTYVNDWSSAYSLIYYANTALNYLEKFEIKPEEKAQADNIKGQALFHRGRMNLELAVAFAKGYDAATASSDPGVPLRHTTDFNQPSPRSSVEETYQQILLDLKTAVPLLPEKPLNPIRPGKAAAYGMLARTCLAMRDYENSRLYADSCLQLESTLLDYNSITDLNAPFILFKMPEVVFYSGHGVDLGVPINSFMDSALISSYALNDLRKSVYFTDGGDGTYTNKATYIGSPYLLFDGIATDEMYLTRAEGFARKGDLISAMKDLDALLRKRYSNSVPYIDHVATDQQQAMDWILDERRKELFFRGLRWMDIKRLNLEGANITIKRVVNETTYTLPPNSPRYAAPIPDDIIQLSGMQQNQYN